MFRWHLRQGGVTLGDAGGFRVKTHRSAQWALAVSFEMDQSRLEDQAKLWAGKRLKKSHNSLRLERGQALWRLFSLLCGSPR